MKNNTKLWIFDINELFYNFDLTFSKKDCLEIQLNTITRIIFIIFLLLICINVKISIIFLLFSLLFIIILYYIKRDMIKENYENQYTNLGSKPKLNRNVKYANTNVRVTKNDKEELECTGILENKYSLNNWQTNVTRLVDSEVTFANSDIAEINMKLHKMNIDVSSYESNKKQFQNLKQILLQLINRKSEKLFPTLSDLKKIQLIDNSIQDYNNPLSTKSKNMILLLEDPDCNKILKKLVYLNNIIEELQAEIDKTDELSHYNLNSNDTIKLLDGLSHLKNKNNDIAKQIDNLLTVYVNYKKNQIKITNRLSKLSQNRNNQSIIENLKTDLKSYTSSIQNIGQKLEKLLDAEKQLNRNILITESKLKKSKKIDIQKERNSSYADLLIENYENDIEKSMDNRYMDSNISIRNVYAEDRIREMEIGDWKKIEVPHDLITFIGKYVKYMYQNRLTNALSFKKPNPKTSHRDIYKFSTLEYNCLGVNDRNEIYNPSDNNQNNCFDKFDCPMTTFGKMIGVNPKVELQPIIPNHLHSKEWNPHGVRVGINDSISIDQEMTGYHVKNKLDMNLNAQSLKQTELGQNTNNSFACEIQPGVIGYFPKQNWNNNQSLNGNIQKCYNSKLIAPFNRDTNSNNIKNGSVITNLNEINPHKLVDQSKPNRFNVYDPRSGGYGDQNRAYVHNVTGQTRYMYDDVDNIRNPNYITRNKIDMIPNLGTTYGQMRSQRVTDPVYLRKQAHQSFLDNTLSFRNSLQYSTMIKGNNKAYAQKQAPIHQ